MFEISGWQRLCICFLIVLLGQKVETHLTNANTNSSIINLNSNESNLSRSTLRSKKPMATIVDNRKELREAARRAARLNSTRGKVSDSSSKSEQDNLELKTFNVTKLEIRPHQKTLCPVSSGIDTKTHGTHSYPIEIFDPELSYVFQLQNSRAADIKVRDGLGDFFRCTSSEGPNPYDNPIFRTCSTLARCPLMEQNLVDAVKNKTWTVKHSFCNMRKALNNPQSMVNVIILGGSVTTGTSTYGCCCDEHVDDKCASFAKIDEYWCGSDKRGAPLCRWSGYFERWIRTKSVGVVNVYNLAHGGWNSPYMAKAFVDELNAIGLKTLTSNDLILIDHSQNDALTCTNTDMRHQTLVEGLENLFRIIYATSTPGSWPSIVLLEFWPYANSRSQFPLSSYDYSDTYADLAKEYQIPVWSYRDLVWSNFVDKQQAAYGETIRFTYTHPPWYIHLFYADMIAALLEKQFDSCFQNGGSTISSRKEYEMQIAKLPKTTLKMLSCSGNALNQSLLLVPHPLHHPKIEVDYMAVPSTGWMYTEERPGKFGFISHRPKTGKCTGQYYNSISFPLDPKKVEFNKKKYLLRIHYLRTYGNAGAADIFLCGKYVTTIDALWEDWTTYHFSYNEDYSLVIDPQDKTQSFCTPKELQANPTLEVRHLCEEKRPQTNKEKAELDAAAARGNYKSQLEGKLFREYINARGNHKVKLVAVQICDSA